MSLGLRLDQGFGGRVQRPTTGLSHSLNLMSAQTKNWIFTINNPTDEDKANCRLSPPSDGIAYLAFEEEVGKEGTPHFQGFLCLDKKRRMKGVAGLPPMKRARLEAMRGTLKQNEAYCSKEGKLESYGELPKEPSSGGDIEKQRWELARTAAKEGRFDDIPADIYLRAHSACHKIAIANSIEPPPLDVLENVWIVGPSGCGKSQAILQEFKGVTYIKDAANKWWDGFNPGVHTVVVIDDIAPKHAYQMSHIKNWMDHRAFPAEIKGGTLLIRPKKLFVTSNHSIDDVFADPKECTEEDRIALKRRFSVIDCTGPAPTRYDPPAPKPNHIKTDVIRSLIRKEVVPVDLTLLPLRRERTETDRMSFTEYVTPIPLFEKQESLVAGFVLPKPRPVDEISEYVRGLYKKI